MGEYDVVIGFKSFRGDFHNLSSFILLTITTVSNNRELIFDKIRSASEEELESFMILQRSFPTLLV